MIVPSKLSASKVDVGAAHYGYYIELTVPRAKLVTPPGYMGGSGNVGLGVSGGIPIGGNTVNQRLTIDIIDASGDLSLAWQVIIDGEVKENATPEQKEAYYFVQIDKALKKFPPKNK